MPIPRFEVPSGAINGTNALFSTSVPYTPGTLAVYINGQLVDFGVFTETNPATGAFAIVVPACIPTAGSWGADDLRVFFLDTNSDPIVEETVTELTGSISGPELYSGVVDPLGLSGVVGGDIEISGVLSPIDLSANIDSAGEFSGTLEECNG